MKGNSLRCYIINTMHIRSYFAYQANIICYCYLFFKFLQYFTHNANTRCHPSINTKFLTLFDSSWPDRLLTQLKLFSAQSC